MNAVDDQSGVLDAPQVRKPLPGKPIPFTECRHLGRCHLLARDRLAIRLALHQPRDECRPRGLTGLRGREEDLLQNGVSFSASDRTGAGPIQRDLLSDHAAQ